MKLVAPIPLRALVIPRALILCATYPRTASSPHRSRILSSAPLTQPRHEPSLPLPRLVRAPDSGRPGHLRPVDRLAQGQHHLQGEAEAAVPAPLRPGRDADRRHRAQEVAQGHAARRLRRRQGRQGRPRRARQPGRHRRRREEGGRCSGRRGRQGGRREGGGESRGGGGEGVGEITVFCREILSFWRYFSDSKGSLVGRLGLREHSCLVSCEPSSVTMRCVLMFSSVMSWYLGIYDV